MWQQMWILTESSTALMWMKMSRAAFFETGTKEDIDAIIGGTYTENEEEMDATEQEIQDIIDQLFKEVRKK